MKANFDKQFNSDRSSSRFDMGSFGHFLIIISFGASDYFASFQFAAELDENIRRIAFVGFRRRAYSKLGLLRDVYVPCGLGEKN